MYGFPTTQSFFALISFSGPCALAVSLFFQVTAFSCGGFFQASPLSSCTKFDNVPSSILIALFLLLFVVSLQFLQYFPSVIYPRNKFSTASAHDNQLT